MVEENGRVHPKLELRYNRIWVESAPPLPAGGSFPPEKPPCATSREALLLGQIQRAVVETPALWITSEELFLYISEREST